MAIQSTNPATGITEKTFQPDSWETVELKITRAENTWQQWRTWPVHERAKAMESLRDIMLANKGKYAKIITKEMGKPYLQSIAEVEKSAKICDFYIENTEKYLQDEHIKTDAHASYITFQPLGIVLGVMPWNYPITQVIRAAVPVIMAGNAFILKHASNVPQSAMALDEMFLKAGIPDHLFEVLMVEGENMNKVIADDRIAAVTVTGGEKAGSRIAQEAGKNLKKVVLELGGSDAFIVLDDADIDFVVDHAVKAKALNAGQSCNSPKRYIIDEKIADTFIQIFADKVSRMKVGDPMDESVDIGPVAREDLREGLHKQVTESAEKGAKVVMGGTMLPGNGYYYGMTVLDHVKKGMPVYDQEVFGPIAAFIRVNGDEEALKVANDSHLGLNATVWTSDLKRAKRFIEDLHVGTVAVNQVVRSDPRLPYGGVKKSGYGREFGIQGIREFVNIKTVVIGK